MNKNFQETVLSELQLLLQPLADAAESEDIRNELIQALGWDVDRLDDAPVAALNTAIGQFALAYADFNALLQSPPSGLKGLSEALTTTEHIVKGILALSHAFDGTSGPAGIDHLGEEMLDYLATSYLLQFHPVAYHLLLLLTVVDEVTAPRTLDDHGVLVRVPLTRRTLSLGQIPLLLTDPVGTLKAAYGVTNGLTDPDSTADKLLPRFMFFAQQLGASAAYGIANPLYQGPPPAPFDFGDGGNQFAKHMLTVFFPLPDDGNTGTLGFGTGIALSQDLGVILRPLGTVDVSKSVGNWLVTFHALVQTEGIAVDSATVLLPDGSPGGVNLNVATRRLPRPDDTGKPLAFLVGSTTGTRLEVGAFSFGIGANLVPNALDYGVDVSVNHARFVISTGDGDGFMQKVLPREVPIEFDLAIGWSKLRGLHFSVGAGLDILLPVHVSIPGVVDVDTIELIIRTDGQTIDLLTTATFTVHLGPAVDAVAQRTGLKSHIAFPEGGGNLGPLEASLGFQLPFGIGVDVHAGAVTGGGFIFLDPAAGRYSGALELQVYGFAVKAFGVLDTRFPDGHVGFSFAIVISAEFTPIQLGFGFTLIGVGGLVGINRSLNDDGLQSAVRSGSLENILFPTDVVRNAPSIINDLATIFPAAPGHYVFGPMAKLGWGTPTLIDAELGIILELPGPRLAILGVLHMALPTKQAALLAINLAVAGVLDFPRKLLSISASLYDSQVVGFAIHGDMAFRLAFGDEPNFALSIGGLHPSYQPPPGFPELRRVSIDLGINGNPSLTAQGYFALTSNTAQVGAAVDLHASGFGIDLDGHLGFDALFVFSPFSFVADFSAGVSVSFHGVGLGVGLHGSISGPTPWHVSASACVSILFWDACLPIDISFGTNTRAELPPMDPWLGHPDPGTSNDVVGLKLAIENTTNWAGSFPAGAHPVVTLTEDPARTQVPIDPVGQATLHQKVLPLNYQLSRFGIYRPVKNTRFDTPAVKVGETTVTALRLAQDKFAPALFKEMSDAEKLSSQPYQSFDSGFTISPDKIAIGDMPSHPITYDTEIIDDQRISTRLPASFQLTDRHLSAMASRGASAIGGIRRTGVERFVDPTAPVKLTFSDEEHFVVADRCSAVANGAITGAIALGQTGAQNALDAHVADNAADRGRFRVVPSYLAA